MSRRPFRAVSLLAAMSFVIAGSVIACSDDEKEPVTPTTDAGPDTGSDTGAVTTGQIEGTATYEGEKKGPLIIAVMKEPPTPGQPPSAPPVGIGSNESPTWPGKNNFTVQNVPEGTWYVTAYIMVGPDHRQGAQPGDPVAIPPKQVTVTAGESASAELTLIDVAPPVQDAGADAGEDAGEDAGADADADAP